MTAMKFRIADAIQRSYAGGNKKTKLWIDEWTKRYPDIPVSGMPV
jgi:hypothetical protein